jgi:hypothetical protein
MNLKDKKLVIAQETVDSIKRNLQLLFNRQNRFKTIAGILFLVFMFIVAFPPDMHYRVNEIRRIQPPRSYHPQGDVYRRANELMFSMDMGELSETETSNAVAELDRILPLEFDVNRYFAILKRLQMEEGYVLDYRYRLSSADGNPVLYARKDNEMRDYSIYGPMRSNLKEGADAYLAHIKTDGTREGFIQLATLHLIGANFYLHWHAFYDDIDIYSRIPATVKFYDDEVEISIFIETFHAWMEIYTLRVKRNFPHNYVSESQRKVIPRLKTVRL